jgi:outer membrane protein
MRYRTIALAPLLAVGAAIASTSAVAQQAGDIQIRALATAILPNGAITEVNTDLIGVPVGTQTEASDSVVPTVAIDYFLSPNFSIETICCITPHDVNGIGAIAGVELIDDAIILPATVTAKYHVRLGDGIKPYVGAGPAYFFIFSENVGAGAPALGINDVDLSDEFGFALQGGIDFALNDSGMTLNLDAKRYFIGTTATFSDDAGVLLQTEHDLDPWVLSAGLGFRF